MTNKDQASQAPLPDTSEWDMLRDAYAEAQRVIEAQRAEIDRLRAGLLALRQALGD